jgi:hypothetical protein
MVRTSRFFASELNYNYDAQGHKYGNDFISVTIHNWQAIARAQKFLDKEWLIISSSDGRHFILVDKDEDPVDEKLLVLRLKILM